MASTSTWTMAFRFGNHWVVVSVCRMVSQDIPLTKRKIATGQSIQHLPESVTKVICFPFRIKRNSHMLIAHGAVGP